MALSSDPAITLLRDLVAIDSVNPTLVPGARGEAEVAARLADELRAAGLQVTITEVSAGRPNVIGVLEGRQPGRTLMLCGHMDTVGVSGMHRPFDPRLDEGKLFGRGSQDMKGGLAAIVGAARALADGGGLDRGRLVVAAVVDEEHASLGAEKLVTEWRADAAVVTEPTGLDVAIAHKGFQWIEVQTRGRAAHGSRPADGRDAILRMGRILSLLEQLDRRLQAAARHQLLGTGSLHASIIAGGEELSSYPARAVLQFERRTLPGERSDTALIEATAIIDKLGREDPEFDASARMTFGRDAYEIAGNHAVPQTLLRIAGSAGCTSSLVGMTFWTDAAILAAAGIPSVLFGPGGAGLHSIEEYVLIEDVCRCRDVLVEFTRSFT